MNPPHPSNVSQSSGHFLAGLIDYAGLFPPARLPLAAAVVNYGRYRESAECWMLGRFIIPAGRLPDLSVVGGEQFAAATEPYRFAALGRGGKDEDSFFEGIWADLAQLAAFRERHGDGAVVDVYEVRLPDVAKDEVTAVVAKAAHLLATAGLRPFFEAPLQRIAAGPAWEQRVRTLVAAIAANNQTLEPGAESAGFKLRCGGVQAADIPSPAQVAFALDICRGKVPLKATAGLHHPLRHFDPELGTEMHGFLNLFGAGILAAVYHLSRDEIEAILADEDPPHFTFSERHFAWQQSRVTAEEIGRIRTQWLISYGSCSFDEPREDLRAMGLL